MVRNAVLLAAVLAMAGGAAQARLAATAFGGVMLDNPWEDVFTAPQNLEFEGSQFVGGALTMTLAEPTPGLTLEVEGQIVRHFGDQTHWEVNAPLAVARWSRFPWSERLATSAAFGIGPSFATETPALEVRNEGASEPTLVYWMVELDLGQPDSAWSVVGRLHHRSTGYGLLGENGGSNALALGVRRRF